MYANEYAGADAVSPLDATSVASGSANLADSGAATTRYANELVVGYGENVYEQSPGAGFAARSDFNGNLIEDRPVMTPGSYNATVNTMGGSTWSMMMATFKLTRGSTFVLVPPADSAVHVATGTPITIKIGANATFQRQGAHWLTNPSTGRTYAISLGGTFGGSGSMLVQVGTNVVRSVSHQKSDAGYCATSSNAGNVGSSCDGLSNKSFTFTPAAANDGVLIMVGCAGNNTPSAVSLSASNWSFTQVGSIIGTSKNWSALFKAYSPNASQATIMQSWTIASGCKDTVGGNSFMNDLVDEWSGVDATNFVDASNSGANSGSCSLNVTPVANNDGLDGFCQDTVTAVGGGFTKGADDSLQDWSEYQVLSGGAGVSQTVNFTGGGTWEEFAVAVKPYSAFQPAVTVSAQVAESLALTVAPSVTLVRMVQTINGIGTGPLTIGSTATGSLLVVGVTFTPTQGPVSSVTDNAPGGTNVYRSAGVKATDTNGGTAEIWYAANSKGHATSLTVTPGGSASYTFWEFSGVDTASPLDATSSANILNSQSASLTPVGPAIATAEAGELVISVLAVQHNVTNIHAGNAFTNDSLAGNDGYAHLIATSTGTFQAQWDQDSSGTYASDAVSFKPALGCTADDGATVNQFLTTATSVAFGTLSPNAFYQGCQDLTVSTNAGAGYSLTVQESSAFKTADGRFIIPDTTCDGGACSVATATAWATPTNNGFGHTCANQSGSDCNPTYGSGKKFKPVPNVAGGTAPGQISFVQQNTSASVGAGCGAGSSCSVAFNSKNTAGNLIIVASDVGSGVHVTSISDSEGNMYATATHAVASPGGNVAQVFYAQNIKGGANTVTITLSTTQYNDLYILEYSGLATGGALDVTSTASGTSNSATSGAATTTAPNELIFGFGGGDSGTYSPGPLFSARSTFDGDIAEDMIVNSSGSYTATASISVSAGWTMSMATFKAASIASQALMSDSGPSTATGRVKYRLSVGSGQPAGTYTTLITYTLTPTY